MSDKEQTRVVWREGGRRSVQTYEPLARDMRPQAPNRLSSDLRYQPLEHGGKCPDMFPLGFRVFDSKDRTAVYLPVEESDAIEKRP